MEDGISARELLTRTYGIVCELRTPRIIAFKERALAEIADDSDWHRNRTGYMGYDQVALIDVGGKVWALARGESCGDYPAQPYDSDIAAVTVHSKAKKSKLETAIRTSLCERGYFHNSLVFALSTGNLALNKKGEFGERMMALLAPVTAKGIAAPPVYDRECIDPNTMAPFCTKAALYKPAFCATLADVIVTALGS